MRIRSFLLAGALLLPVAVRAQAPAPAPAANLVSNGGFELVSTRDNLWDGVDSNGYLAGERWNLSAITESGAVGSMAMPISVAAADLNSDGLMDIMTADPLGYYRIYFNQGSPAEPKFTNAEMVPLYISRLTYVNSERTWMRSGPRISLCEWSLGGLKDLIIGVYGGSVYRIENRGSAKVPSFNQPNDVTKMELKTSTNPDPWGNLFAPIVYDWNKDSRPDLLIGEGSYSANAVHLLLNDGAGGAGKFTDDKRYYLCYGDGREQLIPCLVDYNGDGIIDVLVADRKGTIAVHLGVPNWKPGMELKQSSLVSFGSTTALNGCISLSAADFNGDGKFDLVIGKNNGRIALALNTGTKEQPKFDALTELKGTDVYKRTIGVPSGWTSDYGLTRGYIYSSINCVTAQDDPAAAPAEGTKCLKISKSDSLNKVVTFTPIAPPADPPVTKDLEYKDFFWRGTTRDANWTAFSAPGNVVVVQARINKRLDPGKQYQLSFKLKGSGYSGRYIFAYNGYGIRSAEKVTAKGDRGAQNVQRDEIDESGGETAPLAAGSTWNTVTKNVSVIFKEQKELNNPDKWTGVGAPVYNAIIQFEFNMTPTGVAYLDDVQLVQK